MTRYRIARNRVMSALALFGMVAGVVAAVEPPAGEQGDGVIILAVLADSSAEHAGLHPGDVITKLSGQPVPSMRRLRELMEPFDDQTRELVVRSYDGEHGIQILRSKMGVLLADCRAPWGMLVVEAVRAFHEEGPGYAVEPFRKAIAAGLPFEGENALQPMYAIALYFTRDVAGAKLQLEEFARRVPDGRGWATVEDFLGILGVRADTRYVLTVERLATSQAGADLLSVSDYRAFSLRRYPEAIASALRATQNQLTERQQGALLEIQRLACDEMRLVPEALSVVRRMREHPGAAGFLGRAAFTAHRHGEPELAAALAQSMYDNKYATRWEWACETVWLGLLAGRFDDVARFCDRTLGKSGGWWDPQGIPPGFCWAHARPQWLALVEQRRRNLEADPTIIDVLVQILCMQADPDMKELDELLNAREKYVQYQRPLASADIRLRAEVALVRGQYSQAEAMPVDAGPTVPPSLFEAARFLGKYADSLKAERAVWLRTTRAFRLPQGGWMLLTRDQRLGLATSDATTIRELPLPTPAWWIADLDRALTISLTGRTVLAASQGTIYRLDEQASRWQTIAGRPWWIDRDWSLSVLEPVWDELASILTEAGRKDLVWPDELEPDSRRLLPFMLSDGMWLCLDREAARLLRPRDAVVKAVGAQADIYGLLPATPECQRVYVFTSHGLFDWRPFEDTMAALELPGTPAGPVMQDPNRTGTVPGMVRIALLPQAGGTSFLLELASCKVVREGMVNETLPATWWRQRSPEANRQLLKQTLEQAGLAWPKEWPATQGEGNRT